MSAENIPVPIAEEYDYLSIHASFAATEYGRALSESVRYDKYRPSHVTHERWQELLGPDVNNLNHLVDTYHLSSDFIGHTDRLQPGLLSPRDKAVIKVGAVIHDWGESILPDINYFEKTEADEAAEIQVFNDNLANFYPAADPEVQDLIAEATTEVIFDRESRLGGIFNVIERIGYLRTGLKANQHAREGTAADCEDYLRWLGASVMSSDHITHLIEKGDELSAAHHFLDSRETEITQGFEDADPAIFAAFRPDEAPERVLGLEASHFVWETWRARA
ncbi:MAG TPA: hypothetical protein VM535_01980 [Candidatus Saccharimonadales bacterium]|nr:hypothetical protein [Candidatus Saccharimonadales bacterium]